MRIPWFIYIPLSLIVTFLTLYLCVKDTDTITPPGPEATAESLIKWKQDNPSIRNTTLQDTQSGSKKSDPTPPGIKPQPEPAKPQPEPPKPKPLPPVKPLVKIPVISPSLSSLTQLNLSTQQLTDYAEHMLENHEPQLARIAYERVIDTAKDATEIDRKNAALAISKLTSQTPLWNPDPTMRKNITISISINETYKTSAESIIPGLEQLIFDAADGMLDPTIKLTSSSAPLSSVSIGNNSKPVRFTIKDNESVSPKIHAALFNALRNKSNQSQKLTSTPALPTHTAAQEALQTYITRITWVNATQ